VHFENIEQADRPWATWSLGALMVLISFWGFSDLATAVDNFGMIPAEMWRYGGLTLITSFFLHAGLLHLFGNLYFLLVFGGRVETTLGHWRFLLLVFAATVVGHCFHAAWDPHSLRPCIGASGGISGVLVFYAFKFPGSVLAWFSLRYFRWIHVPAWAWFALWLAIQLIGISMQRSGLSNVSALAHVGGVTSGFLLWLCWRKVGVKTVEVEI
jgi:membrane associated rhomboid family serine protease